MLDRMEVIAWDLPCHSGWKVVSLFSRASPSRSTPLIVVIVPPSASLKSGSGSIQGLSFLSVGWSCDILHRITPGEKIICYTDIGQCPYYLGHGYSR